MGPHCSFLGYFFLGKYLECFPTFGGENFFNNSIPVLMVIILGKERVRSKPEMCINVKLK